MNRIRRWWLRRRLARSAQRLFDELMVDQRVAAFFLEDEIPFRRGLRR